MISTAPGSPVPPASGRSVARVMGLVLLALLPGAFAQIWLRETAFALQLPSAVALGLAFEALMLKLRGQPMRPFLGDLSAPLAAVLLALLLPAPMPWWMLGVGVFAAMVPAKHLYGGLGRNLFNPAMTGYAVLLICFPTQFPSAAAGSANDGLAIAFCYVLGGAFLLFKKVIPWQTPAAMLIAAVVTEMSFRLAGGPTSAFAIQPFVTAPLVIAAFFIVTDPVTGCLSGRGRLCFGAGAGLLTVLLARTGSTPDGLPFAVLLMNCAAPWLDRHTRPDRSNSGAPA